MYYISLRFLHCSQKLKQRYFEVNLANTCIIYSNINLFPTWVVKFSWDYRRVQACKNPPHSLQDLTQALGRTFRKSLQNTILRLIRSMPIRCGGVYSKLEEVTLLTDNLVSSSEAVPSFFYDWSRKYFQLCFCGSNLWTLSCDTLCNNLFILKSSLD